jgi:AcrR family transcriptional regulator
VAKASLYSAFGSKEELVRAYLLGRHERRRNRILAAVSTLDGPRAKLLGIFDYLGEFHQLPTFRGCPFINASAESPPGGAVAEVSDLTRDWVRTFVRGLVGELGIADPDTLTEQLILLYDGCTVAARLDRNATAARTARAAAAALIDSYAVS